MDDVEFEEVVARLRGATGENDPARVVARIATFLGAWRQWDTSFIEEVAREVNAALFEVVLPECSDQDAEAHQFWGRQARALGWESDAPEAYVATIKPRPARKER